MRVLFQKGKQREFIKKVLMQTNSPTLRELANRIQISYSTLKNYFNESRTLSQDLFKELCLLANISLEKFNVEILQDNWGQIKGGNSIRKIR